MQTQQKALAMTLAAALVVCLVAVRRWVETREPERAAERARTLPESAASAPHVPAPAAEQTEQTEQQREQVTAGETSEPAKAEDPVENSAPEPGALEVLVLDAGAPLAQATLLVVGKLHGGLEERFVEDEAHAHRAQTGPDGLARWRGLEPDAYDLLVTHPQGGELECRVELRAESARERVVVRFGGAAVSGRVLDDAGLPRANSRVRLQQAGDERAVEVARTALTDESGRFVFERLEAGSTLVVDASPDANWLAPGRSQRIELSAGERREVELATPVPDSVWRGRLRLAGGAQFEAPLALRLIERVQGWTAVAQCRTDGTFECNLRPGSWSASLPGLGGPVEVARVVLGRLDLAHDIGLPTGCLSATLRTSAGAAVDGALVLTNAEGASTELPAPDGRAFLAGLPPGEYGLEALAFGAERGKGARSTLSVSSEQALVEIVLTVAELDG